MARPPPALPCPLHPDRLILDEPGRTMVRPADRQADPPRRPHLGPGPGERHQGLDRHLERQPPPVHLDQDRRRDLEFPRRLPRQSRSRPPRNKQYKPAEFMTQDTSALTTNVHRFGDSSAARRWFA